MIKKYKLCFDAYALILFFIVMAPNFIWFAIPAPNDLLRTESVTGIFDMVASVCQVLMIAALCFCRNKESEKLRVSPYIIVVLCCCLLYYASWIVYYTGTVNGIVILGLTIPPCSGFLFYAMDRKNGLALIPISVFTICHLVYGVANFIR